MRKFYYLCALCALFTFSFLSCKDDEEDLLTPANAVSNLSFTDYDIDEGKIGGTLSWKLPEREEFIDNYVIYLGESASTKTNKLGEVAAGTTTFDIPKGTSYLSNILVVAQNATGESSNIASIAINDNTGPVVISPTFIDTDKAYGKIGGTLSWTLPESEAGITGYVIYASNDQTKKETKLGEVAAGAKSFEIESGMEYKSFFLIVSKDESGESKNIASIAVIDKFDRLYILNCGDSGSNNASLSIYDPTSGTMTSDVYRTANNKGLGDEAEQLLIYGSKMYITVTASNRLVVLNLDGKELKSLEPVNEEGEPVRPRCMVADNGKVYITYYYGHSVAALDTATLEFTNNVAVGRFPEQLAMAKGKLYVANSGGMDYATGYDKTVSVINPESFEVEKTIEVLLNPTEILADSEGDLYVISMGDYGDVKNTLQRIDGETHEVTTMSTGTTMSMVGDKLYVIYGQWGEPNMTFKQYDTTTEEVANENFIKGRTFSESSTYRITSDSNTGKIYVTDAPWGIVSSLLVFNADGNFEKEIPTGGYYAKSMVFFAK